VAKGKDITILPEYAVRTELEMGLLRALPVSGKPLQRTLKLVWNQGRLLLTSDARLPALPGALSPGVG
jgi:DNA-binding transcriptional LysR family regulator